jgi:hypothetical protein
VGCLFSGSLLWVPETGCFIGDWLVGGSICEDEAVFWVSEGELDGVVRLSWLVGGSICDDEAVFWISEGELDDVVRLS